MDAAHGPKRNCVEILALLQDAFAALLSWFCETAGFIQNTQQELLIHCLFKRVLNNAQFLKHSIWNV